MESTNQPPTDFVRCPYNNSHVIKKHRLPFHIMKCALSYTGPPLQMCPFNSTHLIKATDDIREHYQTCESFKANYEADFE